MAGNLEEMLSSPLEIFAINLLRVYDLGRVVITISYETKVIMMLLAFFICLSLFLNVKYVDEENALQTRQNVSRFLYYFNLNSKDAIYVMYERYMQVFILPIPNVYLCPVCFEYLPIADIVIPEPPKMKIDDFDYYEVMFKGILFKDRIQIIPFSFQLVWEYYYKFVYGMVKGYAGSLGTVYAPLLACVLVYLLVLNVIGIIPFSVSLTSQIIIPLLLAASFNIYFLLLGLINKRFAFLFNFVPSGTPLLLIPFVFVIEVVSYLIRTVSLSVRLFANMMAGHALLGILGTFIITFHASYRDVVASLVFIVYAFIAVLEVGVAFIQSYVFFTLLSIYLRDITFLVPKSVITN